MKFTGLATERGYTLEPGAKNNLCSLYYTSYGVDMVKCLEWVIDKLNNTFNKDDVNIVDIDISQMHDELFDTTALAVAFTWTPKQRSEIEAKSPVYVKDKQIRVVRID